MNIFLSGYYGKHNLGDDAILHVLLHNLKSTFKNSNIILETSDDKKFVKEKYLVNKSENWRDSILESDLVIFGGGGLLSDDSGNSWRDLKPMMKKMIFAKRSGKKVLLIGIGVDVPRFIITRVIYIIEGAIADLIMVRDKNSYNILKKFLINKTKLINSYDLAILFSDYFNTEKQIVPNEIEYLKSPIIGINFFEYFKMRHNNQKQKLFDQEMLLFLNGLIRYYNASIVFLSASKGDFDTKDYAHMKDFFKLIQTDKKLIYDYENPFNTISLMEKCDCIISMKLHISILGYTLGKNIIGISYNSKVTNFYEEIHLGDHCIDLNNFSAKNALNIFEKSKYKFNDHILNSMKKNILYYLNDLKKWRK